MHRPPVRPPVTDGEHLFRALFDHTLDAILIADDRGRYVDVNPAACELVGLTREALLELGPADLVEPERRAEVQGQWAAFLEAGKARGVFRMVRPDGRVRELEFAAKAHFVPGRHLSVLRDVTERNRAQAQERESREQLRLLTDVMMQLVWVTRPDGRTEYVNERWHEVTGQTAQQALGWGWVGVLHPDDRRRAEGAWRESVRAEAAYECEFRMRQRDGSYRWYLSRGIPQRDERTQIVRWFGTCTDIHDLRSAEAEVRQLNRDLQRRLTELQTLLDVIPVGIGIARDRECERIDVNRHFAGLLGISPGGNASLGAPPGERPEHFTCWSDGVQLSADELPLQTAARTGNVVRDVELEVRRHDGSVIHLLEYAAPLLDERDSPRGSVGAFIDISERKKAEVERQRLMEQATAERGRLEAVLRQMPAGVVIAEAPSGRVVLRNEQVDVIWRHPPAPAGGEQGYGGYDSGRYPGVHLDGRPYAPDEWPLARSLRSGERVSDEEIEILRGDGTRGFVSVNSGPILDAAGRIVAGVATVYDVTDRKNAEAFARRQQAELLHMSRLSTMGQMAAGLAHELNQPLGAILNYAGVCLDRVTAQDDPDPTVVRALEEVAAETNRAGEIIRRLRGFVRKQPPKVSPVGVNELVREAVGLASAELRNAAVRAELELTEPPPKALADGVQIEQVLVNLIRNAIDAMRETEPATRRLVLRTELRYDSFVRVGVIDSGCGIPDGLRSRIFDPFFTTKPDGLGMGLPISKSIIEAHGGHLALAPNAGPEPGGTPGRGQTVHFTLPLAEVAAPVVPLAPLTTEGA